MATVTARDLISLTFRRMGITAEGETPSAEQASDGLATLNIMLHGFNADGIRYAHTDLTLSSTVNFPDEEIGFVRDLLTEALAPDYDVTPPPKLEEAIQNARRMLQARYTFLNPVAVDSALRVKSGYIRGGSQ